MNIEEDWLKIAKNRKALHKAKAKNMFRLKELRVEKGISQLKLAMDLNMNQNSVSRYETEQRQADYGMLVTLADYFDVSIDYLLGRTDVKEMQKTDR